MRLPGLVRLLEANSPPNNSNNVNAESQHCLLEPSCLRPQKDSVDTARLSHVCTVSVAEGLGASADDLRNGGSDNQNSNANLFIPESSSLFFISFFHPFISLSVPNLSSICAQEGTQLLHLWFWSVKRRSQHFFLSRGEIDANEECGNVCNIMSGWYLEVGPPCLPCLDMPKYGDSVILSG